MKTRFYFCNHCGNVVHFDINKGTPISCCGDKMVELIANTVDASNEKHLPSVHVKDNVVSVVVGSVVHPMGEDHHISFIYLDTKNGGQIKHLKVDDEPIAVFHILGDEPVAVYEYCNLHGLWKTDL